MTRRRRRASSSACRSAGTGLYAASVNKFYIDELYQAVFVRGGVQLGKALWWFDAKVIDGAVNGAGWLSQRIGSILRRIQTGRTRTTGWASPAAWCWC